MEQVTFSSNHRPTTEFLSGQAWLVACVAGGLRGFFDVFYEVLGSWASRLPAFGAGTPTWNCTKFLAKGVVAGCLPPANCNNYSEEYNI